ncbi:MAG: SPOR domain-containing protein [Gilliamella sp.]|uniref:SPOR domain-containing protein n=1 Tax=Gilliamella sp. TaxID=1891236 RepID=UPI002607D7DD|nr:SPOR domain-containing protein [Gilliamella sp.]MCO6551923.1 SPOR domain-containing protein [Gilliamella sp.]
MRVDKEDRYISEQPNKGAILTLKLLRTLNDLINKKLIIIILSAAIILLLLCFILFNSAKKDEPTPLTPPEINGVATSQAPDNSAVHDQNDLTMNTTQNTGSDAQINQSINQQRSEIPNDKYGNLDSADNQGNPSKISSNKVEPLSPPNIIGSSDSNSVKKDKNSTKTSTNKNNTDKKALHHKTNENVTSANNLKLDNNSYSIQLTASKSVDGLKKLVDQHHITNYQIYETKRNNKKWYILIKGNYSSSEEAHKAIKSLPSALQKDKPWVKSGATINKEKAAK